MDKPIIYVRLDARKDTVGVAVAEGGKRGEVREHEGVANTSAAVKALTVKPARGGNGAARRMLIEAAWSYRFPARISRELLSR